MKTLKLNNDTTSRPSTRTHQEMR